MGFLRWPLRNLLVFSNPSNTSLILFPPLLQILRPHRTASVVSRPLPLLLPSNPTPTPASLYLASQSSISLSAGSTSRKSCVQVPCIRTSISRSAPPHSPRYSLPDQYSRVSDHHRSLQLKPSKTRAHHSLLHSFTTATTPPRRPASAYILRTPLRLDLVVHFFLPPRDRIDVRDRAPALISADSTSGCFLSVIWSFTTAEELDQFIEPSYPPQARRVAVMGRRKIEIKAIKDDRNRSV